MLSKQQKGDDSVSKEVIAEFVNIALASSKIKNIIIKQEMGDFRMRPNINLFVYGQISSTKSTLLGQICKQTASKKPFTDMTFPALIGSVDSMTRQLLVGASWECRNSLLLLDEFDFSKRDKSDVRALLQLIEGGEYNKKMASFSNPSEEIDEDLYYRFKNGEFNIKTRFSLILASMKYPYKSQSPEVIALCSRSIVLPFYPNKEEVLKIAQGHSIFNYIDKTPKILNHVVKRKDWDYILAYASKHEPQHLLRVCGDMARVFVVEGKHRKDLYDIIIKMGSKSFR